MGGVCSAFFVSEDRTVTSKELAGPRRWASLPVGAEYLKISEMTLRRLIKSGRITGFKVGDRIVRVDLNELDAFASPISQAVQ
jgi:excisionase family DNA binding protein